MVTYFDDVKFNSPKEMLSRLQDDYLDLYSPKNCLYAFLYNDMGSICTYDNIDEEMADDLQKKSAECGGEYWGAFLGWHRSAIFDSNEYLRQDDPNTKEDYALDFCKDTYKYDDWKIICYSDKE